jgi:NAD(P)-dependent dehydrogenase (short-subunit alcohol dehydrogenase family)
MRELQGRTAVVTGGASGIGFALADAVAAEGMQIAIADVEQAALDAAVERLAAAHGVDVLGVRTDVANGEEMDAFADAVFTRFGAVHLLCNNAGVGAGGTTWEVSEAEWQWVLGVNLWGVIHGIRAFVPRMVEGGDEGHIVNTASMEGLVATPAFAPYAASKFAVVAISETLFFDLLVQGSRLRASVLCPGWVSTRIHESDRNRPAALADEPAPADPDAEAMRELGRTVLGQLITTGMPADQVAAHVVDAVREERFYILTHEDWLPMLRERMEGILAGRNPALSLPPGLDLLAGDGLGP